ncbi:uncharacterized protein [Asterias amurensis]|uniref:uncharacterized protein n=1 Tax=Asterias amurensis TaxID=7602 RepID=UPI003AB249E3
METGLSSEKSTPKMPPKRQVLGIRVSSDSNKGGRDYMEDMVSIRYERREDNDIAFFGVFDGHGGREAAVFARDMLWDFIKEQRGFESKDPAKVKQAIKEGFLKTQEAMWKKRGNWNRTKSGYPSTAGTTACIAIIRGRHMYVAHVGDSRAVLGVNTHTSRFLKARAVTIDHKPESPKEVKRIEAIGGQVLAKNGVQRVVWERTKLSHTGPVRRSTNVDKIPFLAVARSLGDLWSYSTLHDDYVVSPSPDISHHILNPKVHKCLVLGSDGLWNMLSSSESIYIISLYNFEKSRGEKMRETISQRLVKNSINRWVNRSLRADNTTAITLVFDFPREKPKPTDTEKSGSPSTTKESSPTKAKKESSPTKAKEESSPTKANKESSPTKANKESSPTEANKVSSPSKANKVSSPTTATEEDCKEEDSDEEDSDEEDSDEEVDEEAKACQTPRTDMSTPEISKEAEPVEDEGTILRLKGETDFLGLQGFGTFRPKLKRTNAYRDFTFRFWYPELTEEDVTTKAFWARNRKRRVEEPIWEDDGEWEEWRADQREHRIEVCGESYINFPYSQVKEGNRFKPHKYTSHPSPWVTPPEVEKKCSCFECKNDYPDFCTGWTQKRRKTSAIWHEPDETPTSNGQSSSSSSFTNSNGYEKRKVAKKPVTPVKQKIYNTRNSPIEPEVPLAQRALRSLNKKASESPKGKKSLSPAKRKLITPVRKSRNGRLRSARLLKTC